MMALSGCDIRVKAWLGIQPGFESNGGQGFTQSTGFPRIRGVLRFLAVVE
ncbi:hypothetical protein HanRHA438_Chr04g0176261 [Helianthus annuus]|nr:hypothetical protein HanRHA438_Chr04g0176261 [Helianthus annuus]